VRAKRACLPAGRRGVYAMFNNNGTFSVHLQLP
jgi:hypothetical protein